MPTTDPHSLLAQRFDPIEAGLDIERFIDRAAAFDPPFITLLDLELFPLVAAPLK